MEDSRIVELLSNAFQTLNLPATATLAQVKQARRVLAKELHPDLHGAHESESKLAVINEAVRILELALTPNTEHASRSVGQEQPLTNKKFATPQTREHRDEVSFQLEGTLEGVFDAILVAASWQGDPYEADPPNEFELMIHEPSSASGQVTCVLVARRLVEITVTFAPRLDANIPNVAVFAAELREQAQLLLDES